MTRRDLFSIALAGAVLPSLPSLPNNHSGLIPTTSGGFLLPSQVFNGFIGTLYDVRFVSQAAIIQSSLIRYADPHRIFRSIIDDFIKIAKRTDPKSHSTWTIWNAPDPERRGILIALSRQERNYINL